MGITAASAIIGFAPQAGMGDFSPPYWYKHRATMVDLDVMDEVREGVPEIGGVPVPTFPYKAGPVVAGGFTIQPRLESTLGWLLYGLMGAVDSDDDDYDYSENIVKHIFGFAAEPSYVPWMSFRKHIPPKEANPATDLGQIFRDCKIVGASLVLPNDAPLTMRVDVLGREFELDHAPDQWSWENEFESWESIPVGCQTGGWLKIGDGGDELPVVAATVGFQNVPLDIRQERVYGSPFLEDVTIVQRRLAYDMTVKWNNPDLYAALLTGSAVGTEWSGKPYTTSFEVKAVSPMNTPEDIEPYSLVVAANKVMMSQVGGLTLAGNQSILLRFAGVALETDPDIAYATFTLRNLVPEYIWPT
jgi:hypothetical protein